MILFQHIRWGEIKEFKNLTIIPLFAETGPKSPDYLTMEDAINSRLLIIGEKNSGGSVPELIAQNLADIPVLLLDGEEVIGAKQNRILNASILLAPKSTTVIPVSCVEAHRWSYTTENFGHSDAYLKLRYTQGKAPGCKYVPEGFTGISCGPGKSVGQDRQ